MKICHNCGAELDDNQNFCNNCGTECTNDMPIAVQINDELPHISSAEHKKINKKYIILIALIICLIIGGTLFLKVALQKKTVEIEGKWVQENSISGILTNLTFEQSTIDENSGTYVELKRFNNDKEFKSTGTWRYENNKVILEDDKINDMNEFLKMMGQKVEDYDACYIVYKNYLIYTGKSNEPITYSGDIPSSKKKFDAKSGSDADGIYKIEYEFKNDGTYIRYDSNNTDNQVGTYMREDDIIKMIPDNYKREYMLLVYDGAAHDSFYEKVME